MDKNLVGIILILCVLFLFLSFLFGVWVFFFAFFGFLVFLLGIFLFIYFFLAPRNIFFTFVEEGSAKIVRRGKKFQKCLIQWEERTFNVDWDVVTEEERHLFGGLRFYGPWPLDRIYPYKFEWTGLKPNGEPLHHPPEILDYILLKQDVYFAKIERAEDKDLLPLDISLILTISIVNPYKALFEVQNWLETVINRTIPAVRNKITQDIYENLIANLEDVSSGIFEASGALFDEFKDDYGVKVHNLEIQKIDPPEEQREATLKRFAALQEEKRILILARAEGERIKKVYGTIKELGDVGRFVKGAETVEASGAKWILSIPGIAETLSRALSEK